MTNARTLPPLRSPFKGQRGLGGFSLVELVVVIALIAVFTSLTVTWYSSHQEVIEKVNDQRNAQEIVSMGVYATVAGADFVISNNKTATVENLLAGTMGQTGVWKNKPFRLTNIPLEEIPGALQYVRFENNLLLYDPKGGQP